MHSRVYLYFTQLNMLTPTHTLIHAHTKSLSQKLILKTGWDMAGEIEADRAMARSASPHSINRIRSPFEAGQWDNFAVNNVIQNIRSRSTEAGAEPALMVGRILESIETLQGIVFGLLFFACLICKRSGSSASFPAQCVILSSVLR